MKAMKAMKAVALMDNEKADADLEDVKAHSKD